MAASLDYESRLAQNKAQVNKENAAHNASIEREHSKYRAEIEAVVARLGRDLNEHKIQAAHDLGLRTQASHELDISRARLKEQESILSRNASNLHELHVTYSDEGKAKMSQLEQVQAENSHLKTEYAALQEELKSMKNLYKKRVAAYKAKIIQERKGNTCLSQNSLESRLTDIMLNTDTDMTQHEDMTNPSTGQFHSNSLFRHGKKEMSSDSDSD